LDEGQSLQYRIPNTDTNIEMERETGSRIKSAAVALGGYQGWARMKSDRTWDRIDVGGYQMRDRRKRELTALYRIQNTEYEH
jgi:hypothetical protein